jgi:uncharacterized protein YceK
MLALYLALACLSGCSSVLSQLDNASYSNSNQNNQPYQTNESRPSDYRTTDDTPYAIAHYMNEIKLARNAEVEAQLPQ